MPYDNNLIFAIKTHIFDIFSRFTEKGGGYNYRYYHALRVAEMAQKYVSEKDININENALAVSCLLHDIGKVSFTDKDEIMLDVGEEKHCIEGAKRASEIISRLAPDYKALADKVSEIIQNHHTKDCGIPEVEILSNADDLDEYGCLNVWRMFGYACQTKIPPAESCRYWETQFPTIRERTSERFTIPFFRELAIQRMHTCDEFMRNFRAELESRR